MKNPLRRAALPLLLSPLLANAQWSSDPAQNLSVADGGGDQVQSKIAPTPDGGCYLSWFDAIGNGFDVRLQRLDAAGNELWAHNGVLVADRSFSSTQDYGLDVDSAGNALLAFRDDSGTGTQITAASVSPTGSLRWGAAGVQLTNTSAFVAAPVIAGTNDGHAVVGWTQDSDTLLQRLDTSGTTQWATPITMTPAVGTYSVSDMHDSGSDVIVSLVHQNGSQFFSPKNLVVQKFDSTKAALWGATPLTIFDASSLQFGNFPNFVSDGNGGAVFSWYGTGPLQCYAQHVLANGTEAFPHNGSEGSTNATQLRVAPSVSYDSVSDSTYMFWQENNAAQSMSGLGGQKFDASGVRQWSDQGVTILPLSGTSVTGVTTVANASGAFVFWNESPAFGQDTLRGTHLDAAGTTDIASFDVASTASNKLRLSGALSSAGQVLLTWGDERIDSGDILVQNINADGSLGAASGTAFCFGDGSGQPCPCGNAGGAREGCANGTGSGAVLSASGSASASASSFVLSGAQLPSGQPGLFFQAQNAVSGGAGILFGDGLRCAGGSVVRLEVAVSNMSGQMATSVDLAVKGGVSNGDLKRYQLWYRDPAGSPCGANFNLTNGYEINWLP